MNVYPKHIQRFKDIDRQEVSTYVPYYVRETGKKKNQMMWANHNPISSKDFYPLIVRIYNNLIIT